MHEHRLGDYTPLDRRPEPAIEITMRNRFHMDHEWVVARGNVDLTDRDVALWEMKRLHEEGGRTVVDAIAQRTRQVEGGGHGHGHIFRDIVPMTRRPGFTEEARRWCATRRGCWRSCERCRPSRPGPFPRSRAGETAIVAVHEGVFLAIPVGTRLQFRSHGSEPLAAVAVTMPPWPGDGEAMVVEGPRTPSPA